MMEDEDLRQPQQEMAQMRGTASAGGSAPDKFHFLGIHEAKLTSRLSVIRASAWVSAKAKPRNELPLLGESLCFSGDKHL